MALPAGRTPVALYAEALRRQRRGELDLSRAHLFQLDEIVGAAPEGEDSFQHFLRTHLLGPLAAQAGRTEERNHLLDGAAPSPQREIERHARALSDAGGLDAVLLGLGTNGHVAFNEPGSTLTSSARVVELAATSRKVLRNASSGMTLGLAELRAAKHIALLATGSGKAQILARVLEGDPSPELPASLLRDHQDLTVFADAASAQYLTA